MRERRWFHLGSLIALLMVGLPASTSGIPANKAALVRHYDRFLAGNLNKCTTCHLPSPNRNPESLEEFPHNSFGDRLRIIGKQLTKAGKERSISARLTAIAAEDSDGDGAANETELLLGHSPGDANSKPSDKELSTLQERRTEFEKFLAGYAWRPFETVQRPIMPEVKNSQWIRNPIDSFIAAEHAARKLTPRPEASREILLRRVYMDLIGLSPTPAEVEAFVKERSADAYEETVNRLLDDPRYGERWARHWMDVWRYSDWAGWTEGNQIRDSQPHIWRWRDWIVESLNADKGYDKMVIEMLAADEVAPDDTNAVRATGFLARNYKMSSREQWMEDTLKHTGQAFLGLTLGCAKCHNHMTDPITQREYYRMRAIFEPHWVRIDRVPGQTNTALDGLVRVFDTDTNPPTYLFVRGDERRADTNTVLTPSLPKLFGGSLDVRPVSLSYSAANPDKREYVLRDTVAASEKRLAKARVALDEAKTNSALSSAKKTEAELKLALAEARHESLLAVLSAEKLEDNGGKGAAEWQAAATRANGLQRNVAVIEARLNLHEAESARSSAVKKAASAATDAETAGQETGDKAAENLASKKKVSEKAAKELEAAEKKRTEAEKVLAVAEKEAQAEPSTAYQPRPMAKYPAVSTGRRLAFARWLARRDNPLTSRVAVNQIWARHFGRGLVANVSDFGTGSKPPSHPALLDWLASEFAERGWSMKHIHRLIVMSSTYRMASTTDEANAAIDPDNIFLWRMNSRRLEAEAVRDNLLYVAGNLDPTMGGPDVDHALALTSKRRSLYLRCAHEKQPEFLKIFDGPSVIECYERRPTVMPQQALAMVNSELALTQAKILAQRLSQASRGNEEEFIQSAFWRVLARPPKPDEVKMCKDFLGGVQSDVPERQDAVVGSEATKPAADSKVRLRENLVLVLFNHNDFVTVR